MTARYSVSTPAATSTGSGRSLPAAATSAKGTERRECGERALLHLLPALRLDARLAGMVTAKQIRLGVVSPALGREAAPAAMEIVPHPERDNTVIATLPGHHYGWFARLPRQTYRLALRLMWVLRHKDFPGGLFRVRHEIVALFENCGNEELYSLTGATSLAPASAVAGQALITSATHPEMLIGSRRGVLAREIPAPARLGESTFNAGIHIDEVLGLKGLGGAPVEIQPHGYPTFSQLFRKR
jgi:hypothetical protein